MHRIATYFLLFFISLLTLNTHSYSQDIVTMFKRVKPSVVTVISYNAFDLEDGTGSGFFIDHNRIITNFHVVEDAASVKIRLNDSTEFPVVRMIAKDSVKDIAILELDIPASRKITPLVFRTVPPEQGERVYVVGNPLGFEQSVSDGIVSSVRVIKDEGKVIQFTAAVSPGSSGSPLLDASGAVLGVVRMIMTEGQNLNFAVPAEFAKSIKIEGVFPFVSKRKSYEGQEMDVKDAFVVDTALIGEIPTTLVEQKDRNLWRLRTAALRLMWESGIVDKNINRIARAVKRIYEKIDIEKDTLTMKQAGNVVIEALGVNTAALEYSQENRQIRENVSSTLTMIATQTIMTGKATPVGGVASVLKSHGQIWQDFEKDGSYALLTYADTNSIKDVDIAVFYLDEGKWKSVAANTNIDKYSYLYFTAPKTAEYAILWRVAEYGEKKKEGVIGSMFFEY
ncbi:MAG: serine protease [Ignavibacteriae bacterium]|nr:serine protease [Ignavibacteriota bacterium]